MTTIEKRPLQEAFPDHPLKTIDECMTELGWTSERSASHEQGTGPITCSCGGKVKTGGWIGTEHAWCTACPKGMQLMIGFLPGGNSWGACVDFDRFAIPEDGRAWIPENVWGLHE
jgi:hypothetical protein